MLLIIIWYFFIIIFETGLGLDLIVLASASASASRFGPRLTSLLVLREKSFSKECQKLVVLWLVSRNSL